MIKTQNKLTFIHDEVFNWNDQLLLINDEFVGLNPIISPPIPFYQLNSEENQSQSFNFQLGTETFTVKYGNVYQEDPLLKGKRIEIFEGNQLFYSYANASERHPKFGKYTITYGDWYYKYHFAKDRAYVLLKGFDSLSLCIPPEGRASTAIDKRAYYFLSFEKFVVPKRYKRSNAVSLESHRYSFFTEEEVEKYRQVNWSAYLRIGKGQNLSIQHSAIKGFCPWAFGRLDELPYRTAQRIRDEVSDGRRRFGVQAFSPNEILEQLRITGGGIDYTYREGISA
jgi:hypothetical protein